VCSENGACVCAAHLIHSLVMCCVCGIDYWHVQAWTQCVCSVVMTMSGVCYANVVCVNIYHALVQWLCVCAVLFCINSDYQWW
jgi:hypothetical protein